MKIVIPLVLLLVANFSFGQGQYSDKQEAQNIAQGISLSEAIQLAIENSPSLKARVLEVEKNQSLEAMKYQPGNTNITYTGDALITTNPDQVHALTITQELEHPAVQNRRNRLQRTITQWSELDKMHLESQIVYELKNIYLELQQSKALSEAYTGLINDYDEYIRIASQRKNAGISNGLDLMSINAQVGQLKLSTTNEQWVIQSLEKQLKLLTGHESDITSSDKYQLSKMEIGMRGDNLVIQKGLQSIKQKEAELSLMSANNLPKFNLGYGIQNYNEGGWYSGVEIGASLPLFTANIRKKKQAAELNVDIALQQLEQNSIAMKREGMMLLHARSKHEEITLQIKEKLDIQLPEMFRIAKLNYENGNMSYLEIMNLLELKETYKIQYLQHLYEHNLVINQLELLYTDR